MAKDDRTDRVIETASATTSSDNSNSGPFAYIITAVVLGLVVLLSLAGGGCTAAILATAAEGGFDPVHSSYYDDYDSWNDFDEFNDMDWEDWLQYYEDEYSSNAHNSSNDTTGEAEVAEALDFGIAPYGISIDDEVSASSYAGVPSSVRDYVRTFVSTDKEYQKQVVQLLNDAALHEDVRTDNIKAAITKCDEAKGAFDTMETPAVEGDTDGKVKDALGSAKGEASKRWECLRDEITLLDTTGKVDKKQLWSLDDDAYEATYKAADFLEEAMTAASGISAQ